MGVAVTTMKSTLARKPLELSQLPAPFQMNLSPQAPSPLKLMAARGLVPAPPAVMLQVLYQLQFDADATVRQEAYKSLSDAPAAVLAPSIQAEQPAVVLDWVAEVRQHDHQVLELLALNRFTDDLTIAAIASIANARVGDIIGDNQMRVLRCPLILEELYKNPNARMATIDKLVDLARRNGVSLKGLPGLQSALDSGQDIGLGEESAAIDALLQEEQERIIEEHLLEAEEEERLANMSRHEREAAELAKEKALEEGPLYTRIAKMSIAHKIRLATTGSREAINMLVRDGNRLVHMAAIQSPRIQPNDIKRLASNKSMPDGVIRYIANNRDWTKHYDVMLSLVNNPKTPLADAMSFLNHLRSHDLRQLQRNRNVPQQLARQAKSMTLKRGQ